MTSEKDVKLLLLFIISDIFLLFSRQVENIIDKSIRKILYYQWRSKDSVNQDELNERRKNLAEELVIWEGFLSNGTFLAGSEFTMADVFFFPHLAMMVRGSLSFEKRPSLKRYYDEVSKRSSVAASWPPHFKDSPSSEMFVGV